MAKGNAQHESSAQSADTFGFEASRHFYRYEPPRPLEVIETDIKKLEGEILARLKEVTA